MKILRSDMPVELTVLMVILTVIFALFFAIPFLLFVGLIWIVRRILAGRTPFERYIREDPRAKQHEGDAGENGMASGPADDTIDCEVISARTFDENGQEIR